MRIWSDSFEHRGAIPAEFAMGQAGPFAALAPVAVRLGYPEA